MSSGSPKASLVPAVTKKHFDIHNKDLRLSAVEKITEELFTQLIVDSMAELRRTPK